MKVSNGSKTAKIGLLVFFAGMIVLSLSLITNNSISIFTLGGMALIFILVGLYAKNAFSTFIVSKKGISRKKLLGKDVFIAWGEFKYIGIGELSLRHGDYRFLLYFSKIPLKKVWFSEISIPSQNNQHLFIVYCKELLEEVLKYIDETKIEGIERITRCWNPSEVQDASTSMRPSRFGGSKD